MCQLLSDSHPKARKSHRCDACNGTIAAGDTYCRQALVDGADMWTWKAHPLCHHICDVLARDTFDDCFYPDASEIHEVLGSLLAVVP